MKGLQELMQQAQQLQERIGAAQQALERLEVRGESGGGLVSATVNGRYELRALRIEPSLLTEQHAVIEDLVAAAVNDALRRLGQKRRDSLAEITGGMGLPPGMDLPF